MNRSLAALLVALASGCTMCPDPHDYSGTVPNGSAPQNDFRARSNGIIPIGVVPMPWPQVVESSGGSPTPPELVARALADERDAGAEPAVVETVAADPTGVETVSAEQPAEAPAVTDEPDTSAAEAESNPDEATPATDAPIDLFPAREPEASRRPIAPPLRETPGWRTRR